MTDHVCVYVGSLNNCSTCGEPKRWEGRPDRECGEHRTVGYRAWCFDCHEWCSPALPCQLCTIEGRAARMGDLIIDPRGRWIEYGGTRYVPEWS